MKRPSRYSQSPEPDGLPEESGNTLPRRTRRVYIRRRVVVIVAASLALVLGGTAAFAFAFFNDISNSINRSDFTLPGNEKGEDTYPQNTDETNILVMGLDSRLDQNGNPLPEEVYQALRAGNEQDGGYNANVLMFVHIPAGGGKAVGISIPRDNYVELVGAPMGVTNSKIKEAYGLALNEKLGELQSRTDMTDEEAYQEARAAGRQSQISTVSRFLGDVRIDHFIEVTMGGFYRIAEAVAPIQVCLNQATEDIYSGADFPAGIQDISAEQAISFVRQRRDTGNAEIEFTDFDRTRRQQAFLVSLGLKLKDKGTLSDLGTLRSLIDVAKEHVALDSSFDLLSFASVGYNLSSGNISFVTLPIVEFGTINGSSVNIVDLQEIHSTVAALLNPETSGATATPDAPDGADPGDSVDSDESTDKKDNREQGPSAPPSANDGPSDNGPTVYETWETPLNAGSVPCVK
ncbi:LCP family protein [Lysinibacter sp. HNR]|uniref:LCP family protein n=1 Tax=Lysinibacter sp. HNR TaxID=3031408 RepID=UPI0024352EFD|nr:LCP family protein [Lysinibacter sp. HNR]WGD37061.1 LCP family protein [Lysinibacter sp. HNR]